jgi:hypothetical protein
VDFPKVTAQAGKFCAVDGAQGRIHGVGCSPPREPHFFTKSQLLSLKSPLNFSSSPKSSLFSPPLCPYPGSAPDGASNVRAMRWAGNKRNQSLPGDEADANWYCQVVPHHLRFLPWLPTSAMDGSLVLPSMALSTKDASVDAELQVQYQGDVVGRRGRKILT